MYRTEGLEIANHRVLPVLRPSALSSPHCGDRQSLAERDFASVWDAENSLDVDSVQRARKSRETDANGLDIPFDLHRSLHGSAFGRT